MIATTRETLGLRTPIISTPPRAVAWISWALGRLLHDVVLTSDEITGLTAGLLASSQTPLGETSFRHWLGENRATLGNTYANELGRHFGANP